MINAVQENEHIMIDNNKANSISQKRNIGFWYAQCSLLLKDIRHLLPRHYDWTFKA